MTSQPKNPVARMFRWVGELPGKLWRGFGRFLNHPDLTILCIAVYFGITSEGQTKTHWTIVATGMLVVLALRTEIRKQFRDQTAELKRRIGRPLPEDFDRFGEIGRKR